MKAHIEEKVNMHEKEKHKSHRGKWQDIEEVRKSQKHAGCGLITAHPHKKIISLNRYGYRNTNTDNSNNNKVINRKKRESIHLKWKNIETTRESRKIPSSKTDQNALTPIKEIGRWTTPRNKRTQGEYYKVLNPA